MLLTLSLAGLLAASLIPQTPSRGVVVAGGGGSCSTEKDHWVDTGGDPVPNTTYLYHAGKFVAGSTYTACAGMAALIRTGSPTGTVRVGIYTESTGSPGTLIGTASDTLAVSSIGTSQSEVSFSNMSASLTSGTTYWFVVIFSAAGTGGNLVNAYSGFTGANVYKVSADGSAWLEWDGNHAIYGATFSSP